MQVPIVVMLQLIGLVNLAVVVVIAAVVAAVVDSLYLLDFLVHLLMMNYFIQELLRLHCYYYQFES